MPKVKTSAGLLLYRRPGPDLEFLLVHLGGPFWTRKDAGSWFLPKGEVAPGEDYLAAAKREFEEETGAPPRGNFVPLGSSTQKSGKTIFAWAFEGDFDPAALRSNTFRMEWPPRSGLEQEFPEIDRAAFFRIEEARRKIHPAELPFLQRTLDHLDGAAQSKNSRSRRSQS